MIYIYIYTLYIYICIYVYYVYDPKAGQRCFTREFGDVVFEDVGFEHCSLSTLNN